MFLQPRSRSTRRPVTVERHFSMSKPDSEVPLTSTWLRAHITQGVNSVGGCKLADRQTWTSAGQERSSPIKPLHRAKCKCVMEPAMAGDRMEVLHRESSRRDLPCLRQPLRVSCNAQGGTHGPV